MFSRRAVCAPAPVTRFPGSVSGPCFAGSHSPRPPPLAPPAPQRIAPLCSSASRLLWRSSTPHVRASSATALSSPSRCGPDRQRACGQAWGIPVPAQGASARASVFDHADRLSARVSHPSVLPSVSRTTSAPEKRGLSRLNGWPMHSPVNASLMPSRATAHELPGGCGSLLLHRDGLAPSTPCRSPGALRFPPDRDRLADIASGRFRANSGISASQQ